MPQEVTTRKEEASGNVPLGVLAVLLGGLLSTLNGRMLSVALTDLRGFLHLTVEQAAWLSTTYNMGLMFMAVFSVYLGALLGVRRVLLLSAGVYVAASLLFPFAASYPTMIGMQALAGLSAGPFYPLTLSFILLNLPIRLAHWGLAAYSLSILFSVNIASDLSARIFEQHSWTWICWVLGGLGIVMWLAVYLGMPRTPLPQPDKQVQISWRGLVYWSAGLALINAALDMGVRVRWFDSPAFAAVVVSGTFLLVVAIIRRKRDPNPLIKLPFLRNRTTIILSALLFAFRFFILGTALLIPQFLGGVGGFRNEQLGPVLALAAVAQFLLAWGVAALLRNIDTRLVMAAGFSLIAVTAFACSHLDSKWAPSTFSGPVLLFAAGESLAMLGLVGSIVLHVVSSGAVSAGGKPQSPLDLLTFSSFFHTVRILGGQVGTVLLVNLITERTKFHVAMLGRQVESSRPPVDSFLHLLASLDTATGAGSAHAIGFAGYELGATVQRQAATLAIADGFTVLTKGAIVVLLCILFLRLRYTRLKELG